MSLFPQLGSAYLDESHPEILARMEASYAQSITILQAAWAEADTDQRFYAGDATLWADLYGNLPVNRRRMFNFNRIRRCIDMVSGYQRRNRKSTVVTGIENADDETADQFTKILMHVNRTENVLGTISDAFKGALITGMSFLEVYCDWRQDPVSGTIKVDHCALNSVIIDPFFRRIDLSDCNFIWKRTYLTKRQLFSLLPDKKEEILGLYGQDNRDGKFQFQPESYNYGMKNLITYDEYYYRDYRSQKMLVDTQTGETTEWKGEDKDEQLKMFLSQYPQITVIDQEIPTVHLAIVAQGRCLYDGPNPSGLDRYPFVPVMAYYLPETPYYPWRIQGMVRGLRDSQYLYNRRKMIELDILESQINSGFIYKENALVNPKDVFLQGQGRGLALKKDAQVTDVQQIQAPIIPPTMIELSKILGDEISQISGINEELLGSATDEKAGVLSMLRQGAGLTTLQNLFDNLDQAQKLLGDLMLDLVQTNYTPGKIAKILEGKQPAPQFYNKAFGIYSCAVEEGINTTTQRQMNFAQLMEMRAAQIPIPDYVLLDAATLQNKKELIDSIKMSTAKQQEMAQKQQEATVMELQSRVELAKARAQADRSLGIERVSRVEENEALAEERRAAAVKDEDQALLNLVKTLKEIDSVDIQSIEKLIQLNAMVKAQEAGNAEQVTKSNPAPAAETPSQGAM